MEAIQAVRSRRSEMNVPPSRKAHLFVVTSETEVFEGSAAYLKKLAYCESVTVSCSDPENAGSMVSVVTGKARMFMPMGDLVDIEKERERLIREIEKAKKEAEGQRAKLSNEKFTSRAPEKVIEGERERLRKAESLAANLTENLNKLG